MSCNKIENIIIVGGGTAGWMAASSLANFLKNTPTKISVIESPTIATVGVGEATLPTIRGFNFSLGIDELDVIKKTQATFKLGIEFKDWYKIGHSFFHPFAQYGLKVNGVDFHHYWQKMRSVGDKTNISDYCLPILMAKMGRFCQPSERPTTPLAKYAYAYHFDALLYSDYLRQYALNLGVERLEKTVVDVSLNTSNGFIQSLYLDDGNHLPGDLFIDCSGFQGILIEQALKTGYENWSHWLPCDRAVAIQSENKSDPLPYTRAIAQKAGWQWRIPLQHRQGNGYVYASQHLSDEEAYLSLTRDIGGSLLNEANWLHFTTGVRKKFWNKNCVALGLAGGFLEPLESTSIGLIQTGLAKLHTFFPHQGFDQCLIDEANRLSQAEFERVRDFLILHYNASQREDGELWQYCRDMSLPEQLTHKIELFKNRGHIVSYEQESFEEASWVSIFNGFNIHPQSYDPMADNIDEEVVRENLSNIRRLIYSGAAKAPKHKNFIQKHCMSPL